MPGVDDEGVLLVTGGAPAGEVVVVWRQAEVETRRHPVLGISEDVEGGYRMDGLPCVGMRGGDAVQMGLGPGLPPPINELRRCILELVLGCLLGESALKGEGS